MLPFARNEATRFISPTKTPDTSPRGSRSSRRPIRDVVRPYGEQGLGAHCRRRVDEFVAAIEAALREDAVEPAARGRRVPRRICRGTAPGSGCDSRSTRRSPVARAPRPRRERRRTASAGSVSRV